MNILEKFRHTYDSYFFNRKVQKTIGEDFFFIQIGACDGKEFDPIYRLVQEHNLAGVLVEPIPYLFERLQENYAGRDNLIFENSAVTTYNGEVNMFTISEEGLKVLPPWAIGISSLHADRNAIGSEYWQESRAEVHKKGGIDFDLIKKHRREVTVNAITLDALLEKHGVKKIDLMVIDAEGHELEILKQLNGAGVLPRLIRYESKNLKEDKVRVDNLLRDLGYKKREINGADTIAWLN